jgi:type III secretion protein R
MYDAVRPVLAMGAGAELASGETVAALDAASARAKEPLREFLLKHADARDRATFHGLALRMRTAQERVGITDRDLLVIVPAFVTSELRRAFEIGFLLFIPFLVLDLVISNLLLALGMHMLSPTTVSLPFKLLLFVLADGWHLIARGLVESYL